MAKPPANVRAAARRALEARRRVPPSRRAGTPVGVKRASDLARGAEISVNTLRRMSSYLSRAQSNYRRARRQGKNLETSKAIQAYYLWGGPAAKAWVESELKKIDN